MDSSSAILITRRPLNESERALIKQFGRVPIAAAVFSMLFMAGVVLVLIPAVLGGFIFAMLKIVGLDENLAAIIGISIGFVVGLVWLMPGFLFGKAEKKLLEMDQTLGEVDRISIEHISHAWSVDNMVDGPLEYLIKAGPECYMYLRCDELLDYQKEDESLDFPGSAIVIERLPHSGTILNLQVSGKPVETGSLEAKELHTLDLGPCVVFPQDREFPQMLRDGLGA